MGWSGCTGRAGRRRAAASRSIRSWRGAVEHLDDGGASDGVPAVEPAMCRPPGAPAVGHVASATSEGPPSTESTFSTASPTA